MLEDLFNYVIFLIPLAIFIGRAVVGARNRRNQPPPQQAQQPNRPQPPQRPQLRWLQQRPQPQRPQVQQPQTQPWIPIHFEDDNDNEEDDYTFPSSPPKVQPESTPRVQRRVEQAGQPAGYPAGHPAGYPVDSQGGLPTDSSFGSRRDVIAQKRAVFTDGPTTPAPAVPVKTRKQGLEYLNHLSQLKQAVVMAEVLGPPKACE